MEDMRRDSELLEYLLSCTPVVYDRVTGKVFVLNAKIVSLWTGRSLQMVSQYKNGQTNIPVDFWLLLLRRFWEPRIMGLITPDDMEFEWHMALPLAALSPREFFGEAVATEGEYHKQMTYLCEILGDGQVDELDASTVQAFDDAYQLHRDRDAKLHREIMHAFQRSREKASAR